MAKGFSDEHERSAAGLDYDENNNHDGMRDNAAKWGAKMVEDGPQALLDEVENLLPEAWREQIKSFPITAMVIGVGVGLWLGMKKSDEIIAAGGALVSSAAMANISNVMEKMKG